MLARTDLLPVTEAVQSVDSGSRRSSKAVRLLNGHFDSLSAEEVVDEVVRTVRAGERGILCTVNVAILMMMRSNPRLQRFVDASRWTVADGQPLVWASCFGRRPLPERVTGIDLIDLLCARAAQEGIGVYLLGAKTDTVRTVADVLRTRHSGLDVRGFADGYFKPEQAADRARAVAESRAELLFVAMGVPGQEYFIEDHCGGLGARVVIGVGGSFDVIAGLRKRAPLLIQRLGFEWAYRLAQEPRRLFKRYLFSNSRFLGLMIWGPITDFARSWRAMPRT